MNHAHRLLAAIAVPLLIAAAPPGDGASRAEIEAADPHAPDVEAVRARRAAYVAAMQARRADLIGDFLAPEMVQLMSSGAMEVGRDAIVKSYAETEFKDPAFIVYERVPDTIHISDNGRFAVERGHWRGLYRRDGNTVTGNTGLYQAGWIKRDGVWRVRTESYVRLHCADENDCPR